MGRFDFEGLINWFAQILAKSIKVQIQQESHDQLINKKELVKKLKTNSVDVDRVYISRSDFPKMKIEGMRELRFSEKAVDKWIKDNQTIN